MILLTGAAGFIGFHVALQLLEEGHLVFGVDNLNSYYPRSLKEARLRILQEHNGFHFEELDISDAARLGELRLPETVSAVVHLAAQAGVRYSIENPFAYATSNLTGHLSILEFCRHHGQPLLVYASSSSVYGGNTKVPFSEDDRVDNPVSLYAATKRADELMSEAYAKLYGLRQIGLRFFTVYGPWGRPDMAYWSFTNRILKGDPIPVFNHGDLQRDFTYIDDIVRGVVATATRPSNFPGDRPHRIYNIGNNRPERLMDFIGQLEEAIGRKAVVEFLPMQQGDVHATYADISRLEADYGFRPSTPLSVGLPKFVHWFREYHGL